MATPDAARELDEALRVEARVANLDDVVELPSIEVARQQFQEFAEILLVEALERRELPEDRSKLVAELGQT